MVMIRYYNNYNYNNYLSLLLILILSLCPVFSLFFFFFFCCSRSGLLSSPLSSHSHTPPLLLSLFLFSSPSFSFCNNDHLFPRNNSRTPPYVNSRRAKLKLDRSSNNWKRYTHPEKKIHDPMKILFKEFKDAKIFNWMF